jgi:hypothetical protein
MARQENYGDPEILTMFKCFMPEGTCELIWEQFRDCGHDWMIIRCHNLEYSAEGKDRVCKIHRTCKFTPIEYFSIQGSCYECSGVDHEDHPDFLYVNLTDHTEHELHRRNYVFGQLEDLSARFLNELDESQKLLPLNHLGHMVTAQERQRYHKAQQEICMNFDRVAISWQGPSAADHGTILLELPSSTNIPLEQDECSICVLALSNSIDKVRCFVPCGHPFHLDCIWPWIANRRLMTTCPMCRAYILVLAMPELPA